MKWNSVDRTATIPYWGFSVYQLIASLPGNRDPYAQQTAFLAAQAIGDVDLLAGVTRSLDGRLHPRGHPSQRRLHTHLV